MCLCLAPPAPLPDDVLELPLGWMSGAIASDQDLASKVRARLTVRNRELYGVRDNGPIHAARECVSTASAVQVGRQKPRRVSRPP